MFRFKVKKVDDFKNESDFLSYLNKLPEQFQKAVSKNDFKLCYEIMDIISDGYFQFSENIAETLFKSPFLVSDMFQNVKYIGFVSKPFIMFIC